MNRKELINEFWKTAKNPKYNQPYTQAAHRLIDLLTTGVQENMFVSKKATEREVSLVFEDGKCTLKVEGICILSLVGDRVILHKYVSSQTTGLKTNDRFGVVSTEVES